jgi:hypothetical protein
MRKMSHQLLTLKTISEFILSDLNFSEQVDGLQCSRAIKRFAVVARIDVTVTVCVTVIKTDVNSTLDHTWYITGVQHGNE